MEGVQYGFCSASMQIFDLEVEICAIISIALNWHLCFDLALIHTDVHVGKGIVKV